MDVFEPWEETRRRAKRKLKETPEGPESTRTLHTENLNQELWGNYTNHSTAMLKNFRSCVCVNRSCDPCTTALPYVLHIWSLLCCFTLTLLADFFGSGGRAMSSPNTSIRVWIWVCECVVNGNWVSIKGLCMNVWMRLGGRKHFKC